MNDRPRNPGPPLRPDELFARRFASNPGRLIEIAQATGNRSLERLALQMKRDNQMTKKKGNYR